MFSLDWKKKNECHWVVFGDLLFVIPEGGSNLAEIQILALKRFVEAGKPEILRVR